LCHWQRWTAVALPKTASSRVQSLAAVDADQQPVVRAQPPLAQATQKCGAHLRVFGCGRHEAQHDLVLARERPLAERPEFRRVERSIWQRYHQIGIVNLP
jgi:hypothetical protein